MVTIIILMYLEAYVLIIIVGKKSSTECYLQRIIL